MPSRVLITLLYSLSRYKSVVVILLSPRISTTTRAFFVGAPLSEV